MTDKIDKGDQKIMAIRARETYSDKSLAVSIGEQYHIWCEGKQTWVDFFIPASPVGYNNPLGNAVGLRLRGVRCMCLCGVYNKKENTCFPIGNNKIFTCPTDGELSFFANDVPGFYWNNWGTIQIHVKRIL